MAGLSHTNNILLKICQQYDVVTFLRYLLFKKSKPCFQMQFDLLRVQQSLHFNGIMSVYATK